MPSRGERCRLGTKPEDQSRRHAASKHTHTPHCWPGTRPGLTDRARGEQAWTQKTHQQVLLGEDRITRDPSPKQELGDVARHECWEHGHA